MAKNILNRLAFTKTQLTIYPSQMEIVTIDKKATSVTGPAEQETEAPNTDYTISVLRAV